MLVVKIENSPADPRPMSEYMDNDEGWHKGVVINCIYGWHYACLPSRGIWAPVSLREKQTKYRCEKPLVSCRDIKNGIVDICIKIQSNGGKVRIFGEIQGKNHEGAGGSFTYETVLGKGEQVLHLETRIPDPKLWWPVDHGDQNLYTLKLTVADEKEALQSFCTTFGMLHNRDDSASRRTL